MSARDLSRFAQIPGGGGPNRLGWCRRLSTRPLAEPGTCVGGDLAGRVRGLAKARPARLNDVPQARTRTGRAEILPAVGEGARTRRVVSRATWVKTTPMPGKPAMLDRKAGLPKDGIPRPTLNSTSPSRPLNMTAGRHRRLPAAAMLRTASAHGLPSAVPEANTPPGAAGLGEFSVTVGAGAGSAELRGRHDRERGENRGAGGQGTAAGADPPAAAGHPQHRGRGDLQRAELLAQPLAQGAARRSVHWPPPACRGGIRLCRGGASPSAPESASAPLARSLASALAAWLRTVLAEQPSRAAAWASLRSSQ